MTAFAVVALLVAAGMWGAYGWLGRQFNADEEERSYRSRRAELDTEPWPAP